MRKFVEPTASLAVSPGKTVGIRAMRHIGMTMWLLLFLTLLVPAKLAEALTKITPDDPNEICTRTYQLLTVNPLRKKQDLAGIRKFFEELGVDFPEETSVAYDEEGAVLVVTHKNSSQQKVRKILEDKKSIAGLSDQVTIEVRFLQLPRALADDLFVSDGGLSKACILKEKNLKQIDDLVRKGKIVELARPKLTTVSGNTAQVKSVREHRYPTDVMSFVPGERSTNRISSVSVTPYAPGGFETREVGYLFNATPTLGPDGSVMNITLVPEMSSVALKPRQYSVTTPSGKVTVEQPEFISYQSTTTVMLRTGQTMLLSVMDPVAEDGKLTQNDVVFVLLSASVVRE